MWIGLIEASVPPSRAGPDRGRAKQRDVDSKSGVVEPLPAITGARIAFQGPTGAEKGPYRWCVTRPKRRC
jgi:hypothetical protein